MYKLQRSKCLCWVKAKFYSFTTSLFAAKNKHDRQTGTSSRFIRVHFTPGIPKQ